MKRRHSHNKDLREHASASTPREQLTTTTTTTTTDAVQPRATDVPDVSSQSEPPPPIAENPTFEEPATSLAVDDRAAIAIDESDNDEPLLPVSPQRGGPKDERARLLLQKYGLTYDRQVRAGEYTGNVTNAGPISAARGHVHRVAIADAPILQVDELAPQSAALAAATPAEDVTYAEDAPQTSALSPGQSSRPLEAREPSETHAHDNITSYPGLTMYARPTSGERLALQPGVNPRPRRDPHSQEGELILGNEPQMVKTVQRVYKKPRQRVRYTCDRCQTIFVDAERCRSCGHDRCSDCNRDPPRKANRQPDPAVLQAVNERLAQRFPEYPVAIAAAG
ncbi:hypothetical protein KC332_g7137 [Hortaea werneckii]|nr:hypothetical protein KC358_g12204 [Hortaea werneckii]KAI6832900.1 hypothetical protein KC350_g7039 [Hortaea werneckii]KAI6928389.1 hypothetical protein KC348_g8126 [Hortaea werneckii]KAI6935919.1 hypothetical protein KC341_g6586 [Hortaea werneckii]KAI6970837.1 hypothetical protein KC321_g7101 [Hortaea werneckii]